MITPPVPMDESNRLAALQSLHILDTPLEERFDRITRVATRLFNVPIALISLVDANRQWFKSRQGTSLSELPRSISFCGHAILNKEALVIPDAREDLRFFDNPLVKVEPYLCFYAGQPLLDRNGNALGTLCIIDRFPRQMSETDLQSLRDLGAWAENELNLTERKRIDLLKNEFVSTVSHELRTPLTSIRGSLGLLAGGVAGDLPPSAKTMVDIAYKNSERLIRLINDILDIEKIANGKMAFHLKPQDLVALIEQAIEANRPYGAQFGVDFQLIQALPDVKVLTDSDRLMQVLTNLLSNAAKFSPAGDTVFISMLRLPGSVRVTVTDHGPGIPEEFQQRIFQKFVQADASDTRQKGGTGLGLSIARAIVERLGGKIGFTTAPNQGTTFYFDFPEWQEEKNLLSELSNLQEHQKKPCILICEDEPEIANLLSLMLEQNGFETNIAYDAAQARQLLAQNTYTAMTLDLVMPNQDGLSLIQELRQQKQTAELPIVVVSANAESGLYRLKGSTLEMVDWIGKPIDQTRLITAVKRITGQRVNPQPRILHVEDDPDILQVVAIILHKEAQVSYAFTLEEAKRKLKEETFDLVILDLELPDGSGLELLPLLNNSNGQPTPVVIFSAQEVGADITRHVTTALVKSRISNQDLVATIKSLINQS